MAEFGVNATQLPEASGAGANPIGPATAGPLDNGVGGAINNMLSIFAKGMDLVDREKAKAKMSPVLAEYSRTMGGIASAVETGGLNAKEALVRSRSVHKQYLASAPELVKDLEAVHSSFFGGTSLNAAQQEEKVRIESFNRLKDEARSAGFPIPNDASDDLSQKYVDLYQQQKRDNANFQAFVQRRAEERAQTGFTQGQEDRIVQEGSIKFIAQSAGNVLETSQIHLRSLMDAYDKAPDKAGAKNNAIIAWNGWWAGQKTQLMAIAGKNPNIASGYDQMFRPIEEFGRKLFEEGADVKTIEDQVKAKIAAAKLQLLQDPAMLTMAAADGLMNNASSIILQGTPSAREATAAVLANMKAGKPVDFTGNKEVEELTFKVIDKGVTDSLAGKADPKTTKDTITGINATLESAANAIRKKDFSTKDLSTLGVFLSQPNIGKFLESNPLDPTAAVNFRTVFKDYYERDSAKIVDSALAKAFSKENSYTVAEGTDRQTARYVQKTGKPFNENELAVEFSGGSAVFTVRNIPSDPQDRKFFMEQLKELKPYQEQINRTVRIAAHIEGRTDYDKFWEEKKYVLLPRVYPLRPGTVVNGMKYKGEGDWKDKNNWEKVNTNGG